MQFFTPPLFYRLTDENIQNLTLQELNDSIKNEIENALMIRNSHKNINSSIPIIGMPNIAELIIKKDINRAKDVITESILKADTRVKDVSINFDNIDFEDMTIEIFCSCSILSNRELYKTSFSLNMNL
ncbi:hypothetical protein [Candidatus Gromoviella agglomerans]|uniref:hypothetical protein n=1 Tax=Candidatus Gromoviella agglomerans TaxID=2806609 RepID=UPI001E5BBEC7|nr:hypothetical protein [Candidatus Gromoviella agglomerans]UFX98633.1 hypothetical protein Gromo_00554 [Candidatus Gromoviella agglomerans]